MPLLQHGEYRPDVSDFLGTATRNIRNVIPRGDGYGPAKDFAILTQALPAACRGGFYALKTDGSVAVFAGTSDRLWLASNSDYSWTPVSKPVAVTSITNASPAVINYTSHPFAINDTVVFSTTGTLPTGLTAGTVYYIIAAGFGANSFRVSLTLGGAAINTSSAGSGTHSVTSTYPALSTEGQWQFAQFGNLVFATQKNAPLQVYDLSLGGAFGAALGSPPQAAYISVVGRFIVLSGLLSLPYRIQWSGLNNVNAATSWDGLTLGSDHQDFPDGGIVRGVAGGEAGIVFQDQAIRRMSYIPGSAIIFQIERIAEAMGLFAPYSLIRAGSIIFFYSAKGFYKIQPGGVPEQIGREKFDRTFFDDLDKNELRMFIGCADPRSTMVFWAYKSTAGATGLYDKILGYDYVLERAFPLAMTGEYLLGMSQPGITLENLDTISSSLDSLGVSLDSYAVATQPLISQFNNAHRLGFFTGANLEATMESSEQGTDEDRIFLKGFRPITDATTFYGSASYRDKPSATATAGTEVLVNSRTGKCDIRKDTRYSRYKVRIPAGQTWTFCAGVIPDVTTGGSL